jgi:hypothetical protein
MKSSRVFTAAAAAVALLCAQPAFADSTHDTTNTGNTTVTSNGGNVATGPVSNTNVNSAHGGKGGAGGNASASNNNSNVALGGAGGKGGDANQHQGQSQNATAHQGQSQSTANANNSQQSVRVDGDTYQRAPVSTAYSAPLTAGSDTCMGSSSAGGQGIGFGLSLGTTWTDKNCVRLKNARELAMMGFRDAAVQLLCEDKAVARAMAAAGTACDVKRPAK